MGSANRGVSHRRLVIVAGPTGTGKSELGMDLAQRLDGEIVNADSMQLYRGMDIGTAKLPVAERRGIPHHLLDVLEVTQTATVASYQRDARIAIEDILARGRTPVLVGGSGLYIQAVVDEIDFPATDPVVRARWEGELEQRGVDHLFGLLTERDPAAAIAIGPANGRKIVRALEVIDITGRPFTATMPRPGVPRYDAVLLRLDRPTPELDQRLEARVRAMVAAGFLDEVRTLAAQGLREGVTASRALGYAQLLSVVDGELDAGAGDRDDGGHHPAIRPQAAVVVPPGPSDDRPGRHRPGRRRPGAASGVRSVARPARIG